MTKTIGAALITAALSALLFTACPASAKKPKPASTPPVPTPKYKITFGVQGAYGTLTAKGGEVEIETGDKIEPGKTITFSATPAEGFEVEKWTLDGVPVTEAGTRTKYTLTVTKACTVKVFFGASRVEGGARLILANKGQITVTAKTEDRSAIQVEGCTETTFTSGRPITLNAQGKTVILKGNITELYCQNNQLTALNVQGLTALTGLLCHDNQLNSLNLKDCTALQRVNCQNNQLESLDVNGCTALQWLFCDNNKLNADAMTQLLKDLPQCKENEKGQCALYTERTGVNEDNHKDFTSASAPQDLKDAFQNAKTVKHWTMNKLNSSASEEELQ